MVKVCHSQCCGIKYVTAKCHCQKFVCHSQCYGQEDVTVSVMVKSTSQSMLGSKVCMSQLMLWSRGCHSQCYGQKYITINVRVKSMYVTVNVRVKGMSQTMLQFHKHDHYCPFLNLRKI